LRSSTARPRFRQQPERTCLGCRSRDEKENLLRIVRDADGAVRVDPTGRANGRGAYVHPSKGCIRLAMGSGGVGRALKAPLRPAEAASLMKEIEEAMGEHA
jgi:predicted RNA-binding protein YlxR (DUF448 family)